MVKSKGHKTDFVRSDKKEPGAYPVILLFFRFDFGCIP